MAVYIEACIESQFSGVCDFSSCVFNPVNWFLWAKGLMACIVDPRFKECKFLGPKKHTQVKGALTGLVCKEKELLEDKQDSAASQINGVCEPVTKKRYWVTTTLIKQI